MKTNYIEELLKYEPFSLNIEKKKEIFLPAINEAFFYHMNNNIVFKDFCVKEGFDLNEKIRDLFEYPYLPVNIFKKQDLSSVPDKNIKLKLQSSATSGIPSTIYIDDVTAKRQAITSSKVISSYIGTHRRPFLILDEQPKNTGSKEISARQAATRGFALFASEAEYYLKEDSNGFHLDIHKLENKLRKIEKDKAEVCIFGFTFVLYNNLVKELKRLDKSYILSRDSKVIHIGGWKKLEEQKVSKEIFLTDTYKVLGITENNIFDFYGFTEQMGLLYGNSGVTPKVTPVFSEIIIRDFKTLKPCSNSEIGLIQILTPLPHSYPAISVLTEDVGRIVGIGKDKDGRWGTQFEVLGRAKEAEARGCGDLLAELLN